ncbi:MAG: site-specific DNA-methyltransferase [Propionibacterium sp.]|nr:site-specific DNA-methyltransferase [Propionibacterium sp.]
MRDWGSHPGVVGMEASVDAYVADLLEVADALWRVVKADGTVWLNVADSYSTRAQKARRAPGRAHTAALIPARPSTTATARAKSLLLIPQRLELALVERGWLVRSEIVWHKPNAVPEVVRDRPRRATERVILLSKSPNYLCESAGDDVWEISTRPSPTGHQAGFPLELPARCIQASTRPGDLVVDPFCGGGITGVAATLAGRRFLGIDTDTDCLDDTRSLLEEQGGSQQLAIANC